MLFFYLNFLQYLLHQQIPLIINILKTYLIINNTLNKKNLLNFQLKINNSQFLFNLTPQQIKQKITINISNHKIPISISLSKHTNKNPNNLQNYIIQFLQ